MRFLNVFTQLWAPASAPEAAPLVRARRFADPLLFAVIVALLAYKALSEVDAVWDSLNYHLPFAARRAGLIPADAYRFQEWLELCYQGIPALPYYLYGALWRLIGTANATNLLSVAALAGYVTIASRQTRAPLTIVAIALLAIPVVHVNVASSYTDLVTNLAFAGVLLMATLVIVEPERLLAPRVFTLLVLAAISANFKLQYVGIVGGFVPLFFGLLLVFRQGGQTLARRLLMELSGRSIAFKIGLALAVALCYASAAKNLYFYGNPFFPIAIHLGGLLLPGVPGQDRFHAPAYLTDTPQPFIWAASVLEYLALGSRPLPYTVGQGNVAETLESTRMGGYLSFFVVFNLAIFAMSTLSRGGRHLLVLGGFVALTVAVSFFPASHELRYYSFWMIYLVTMNLAYCWKWRAVLVHKIYFALTAAAALAFVMAVTGGDFVLMRDHHAMPRFTSLDHLKMAIELDRVYLPAVTDGGRYCLLNWGPYPFLGAAYFHPGRNFAVVEAEAIGCPADAEPIDLVALRAAHAR